ncbi:hypothetical protein ACWEFJ_33345 [Actinosynnema sp. NPDC004786]
MTRVVVVAIVVALVAVLAPSPLGHAKPARPVPGHAVAAGTEEEPGRECRGGPEPRHAVKRPQPARPAAGRSRAVPVDRRLDVTTGTDPPVDRGRREHLRSWSTPSALQVFRN